MSDQPEPTPPEPTPPAPQAPTEPPPETWQTWLAARLLNAALFLGVALATGLLLYLFGFHWKNCVGYGLVGSFFLGSFFLRQTVMQAFSKAYPNLFPPPPPQQPIGQLEGLREVAEMVVSVLVMVLLLRAAVIDIFYIPTGSMAETLYGYQKMVRCPECGTEFPVNCSDEAERGTRVTRCTCPNCRLDIDLAGPGERAGGEGATAPDPGCASGDRVVVAKCPYGLWGVGPGRWDVVVFRFPGDEAPSKTNYIKRLVGLPGETIAICRGNLYAIFPDDEGAPTHPEDDEARQSPSRRLQMWRRPWLHADSATDLFGKGQFRILRKPPAVILEVMRLVYDNDRPARDLLDDPAYDRWVLKGGWEEDRTARSFTSLGEKMGWLRYQHVLRESAGGPGPQLITDFLGYNGRGDNWASDLVLECTAEAKQGEGELALELAQGPARFRAVFDAGSGKCTLYRLEGERRQELQSAQAAFKGPGTFRLRLANVDSRLTVWVNGGLPFGDGVDVEPPRQLAPTVENDLERPASVGSRGGQFVVSHLKLFRDLHYTLRGGHKESPQFDPARSATWDEYKDAPCETFYVQPGHYFCLGDNSPQSADGREWGLVPQRLLLGRALLVVFPFTRFGLVR